MKLRLTYLLLLSILFVCCQKDHSPPQPPVEVDYRDAFVGKYQVQVHTQCYGNPQTCNCNFITDTTFCVNYSLDSTISFLGKDHTLHADGTIDATGYINAKIVGDSIFFYWSNGALGCQVSKIYKGKKISKLCY